MKKSYPNIINNQKCYGCSACQYFCPTNAVELRENNQGFLYPTIDIEKCIKCGKCEDVCPLEIGTGEQGTIYQVLHCNKEVQKKSQSGGMFTALSDYILSLNGVVYGATFDDRLNVVHSCADNRDDRDLMCKSKYVQSIITVELIDDIKKNINAGKYILFTGTPCQCAMVSKNFGSYEKMIICDFICHGVPSPEVWKAYIKYIEKKNHIKIEKAVFRNKICRGKGNHTESFFDETGKEIFNNEYSRLFYTHLAHRKSCFFCQFAQRKRVSDITIGGFLEKSDFLSNQDSSMVILNTVRGRTVFDEISDKIIFREQKLDTYYKNQPCLYRPVPKPELYEEFWNDFQTDEFAEVILKYATEDIEKKFHIEILD